MHTYNCFYLSKVSWSYIKLKQQYIIYNIWYINQFFLEPLRFLLSKSDMLLIAWELVNNKTCLNFSQWQRVSSSLLSFFILNCSIGSVFMKVWGFCGSRHLLVIWRATPHLPLLVFISLLYILKHYLKCWAEPIYYLLQLVELIKYVTFALLESKSLLI